MEPGNYVCSISDINIAGLLCDSHAPAAVAYKIVAHDFSSTDLTYGELRSESERLAAGLASLGIQEGDRVATLMGKGREYLVTLIAIWRLGAVYVPLFTAFAPASIALRLKESNCKLVICDPEQRAKLEPGEHIPDDAPWKVVIVGPGDERSYCYERLLKTSADGISSYTGTPDDVFIEIYTSGTVGKPKGVAVPARALAAFKTYAHCGLDLRPTDVFWNAADPGWAYGLYLGILCTFLTGVPSIISTCRFSAASTIAILSRYKVTNFTAAPTVYRTLQASELEFPNDLSLRCASSAGEPLTPEVNIWATQALGVPVYDHYGQTELGMLINNHHHADFQRPLRAGSMGHAMLGWAVAVLKLETNEPAAVNEVGRIAVDRPASPLAWFTGYLGDAVKSAEKLSEDGRWYLTGDLGRTDADGYHYFASREDDMIIMAGYRISPMEVESVLMEHPAVRECAAVAVPDQVRGELLVAVVVVREDFEPSESLSALLQDWIKRRYSAHAYPRRVHYVDSLPRTPSGKVQRFLIRQLLAQMEA